MDGFPPEHLHFDIPLEVGVPLQLIGLDIDEVDAGDDVVHALDGEDVKDNHDPVEPGGDLVVQGVLDVRVEQHSDQKEAGIVHGNAEHTEEDLDEVYLVWHVPDPHINSDYHDVEDEHPRPAPVPHQSVLNYREVRQIVNSKNHKNRRNDRGQDLSDQNPPVEVIVLLTLRVQIRLGLQLLLWVNGVKQSEVHDGQRGEEDIIKLEDPHLVNEHRALDRQRPVKQNRKRHQNVLVQSEQDHPAVPVIKVHPVKQHQPLQVFELTDNVIRRPGSLTAFDASHSYSHMCRVDHVDVIGPVADGQSPTPFLDHGGDLLLALGRDSAANDRNRLFEDFLEHFLGQVVQLRDELPAQHCDFVLLDHMEHFLNISDEVLGVVGVAVKSDNFVSGVDEPTGVPDGNGGLLLITSEHPDLDWWLFELADGFLDFLLELVFDGSYGHELETLLDLRLELDHFLVPGGSYDCEGFVVARVPLWEFLLLELAICQYQGSQTLARVVEQFVVHLLDLWLFRQLFW